MEEMLPLRQVAEAAGLPPHLVAALTVNREQLTVSRLNSPIGRLNSETVNGKAVSREDEELCLEAIGNCVGTKDLESWGGHWRNMVRRHGVRACLSAAGETRLQMMLGNVKIPHAYLKDLILRFGRAKHGL